MNRNHPGNPPYPEVLGPEILRDSTLPILVCNTEGRVVYHNESYAEYFGVKKEKHLKDRFVSRESWAVIRESLETSYDWDGYSIFFKGEEEEIILKVKVSKFNHKEGDEDLLVCYFTETNEARQRIFRQGQLLKASSESSTLLVVSADFRDALDEVVESMGKAVQADRCYIFESTWLPDSDQIYASLLAQWSRTGGLVAEPEVQMISYTIFPRFYETLFSGKPYSRQESDFTGNALKFLHQRSIQSLICLPIFKDNILWGFMGFDDCQQSRTWEEQEIASLTLLTNSLSSILSNNQLREEIEKKNTQLESAILGSKDSLWDYDIKKERLYYSPQFLDLLGYRKGELKGSIDDLNRYIHPQDLSSIYEGLESIIQNGVDSIEGEIRLLHKNGKIVWIKLRALTTRDISGHAIRISGSNTDITLEKEYESRIAESQEKYIELVDNLREIVFQLNADSSIAFLNEAWEEISGVPVSQTIGQHLENYIIEEDREHFTSMCEHLLRNPNAYLNCLVRFRQEKQEPVWAEIYARSIAKQNAEPYILGTIIDVSQRHVAEQRLKESELRYRLISENISDLVTLQDESGKFIYVSPSVVTILGMNAGDLVGKKPKDIWKKAILKETAWEDEKINVINGTRSSYLFTKPNGAKVWLETVRSLVDTGDQSRFLIQSTTRDISAFKEAENNLKTALEKQKELNELRSDFISMASHEFRTPLTTIRSSVQLLQEYGQSAPEEQRQKMLRHYGRIKEQIERVTSLMNDVLTLGRFEAGKTPFDTRKQDLMHLVEELIADHFSQQHDGREIHLKIEGSPAPVLFDSSLMTHILINLITNAFKYSEGKKDPVLTLRYGTDKVTIEVLDYGIGVPQEDLERVFQSFYRAKNALEVPGTGLGLVITKEFVQLHKGSIYIESELNKETRVIVELPI